MRKLLFNPKVLENSMIKGGVSSSVVTHALANKIKEVESECSHVELSQEDLDNAQKYWIELLLRENKKLGFEMVFAGCCYPYLGKSPS